MSNTENKEQETIENKEKEKTTIKQENIVQQKTSNNAIQKGKKEINKIDDDVSTFFFGVVYFFILIIGILAGIGALLHFKEYINIVGNSFIWNLVKSSFNIFKQNIYVCLLVICFIGIVYNFSKKSKTFIKNSLIFILCILIIVFLICAIIFYIYTHLVGLGLLFNIL